MKNFEMFVIGLKMIPIKLPDNYVPIQVGKNNTKIELPYISDDTLDNISEKNANYCELTAIYWLWKNYNLPKYVGLCHYRRFLTDNFKFINERKVNKIMKDYDVILPIEHHTKSTVYNFYFKGAGKEKDLKILRDIISKKYNEYLQDYDDIMNSESTSYCNMGIFKKEDYISYCKWLFDVLFDVEKEVDLTGYNVQEARIFGYMGEFLLDVWIKHNNLKIYHTWVYMPKNNKIRSFLSRIKIGFKNIFHIGY